jgi:hypothetical protein
MIKKEDEHGGMGVMSGKLGCGLCLYFVLFTIAERVCVLAVWIVCGEGESQVHKLHYWQ